MISSKFCVKTCKCKTVRISTCKLKHKQFSDTTAEISVKITRLKHKFKNAIKVKTQRHSKTEE